MTGVLVGILVGGFGRISQCAKIKVSSHKRGQRHVGAQCNELRCYQPRSYVNCAGCAILRSARENSADPPSAMVAWFIIASNSPPLIPRFACA